MDRDKLKTINGGHLFYFEGSAAPVNKFLASVWFLMPLRWLIYLRMWHLQITKPRSYAWQEVSHVGHHRWVKHSSSCPRSFKGVINIKPSTFVLQLQSTPFIFGNQLNEDFLKKIGGNQYTFIWHKPIRSQLRTNIRLINWNNRRKAKLRQQR